MKLLKTKIINLTEIIDDDLRERNRRLNPGSKILTEEEIDMALKRANDPDYRPPQSTITPTLIMTRKKYQRELKRIEAGIKVIDTSLPKEEQPDEIDDLLYGADIILGAVNIIDD